LNYDSPFPPFPAQPPAQSSRRGNHHGHERSHGVRQTPGTGYYWYQYATGVLALSANANDCAFYYAQYVKDTSWSQTLKFGNAGKYLKCLPWIDSNTNNRANSIEGVGADTIHEGNTTIATNCATYSTSSPILARYPSSGVVTMHISNITFEDYGNATGGLELDGTENLMGHDVRVHTVATATNCPSGSCPALRLGNHALGGAGGYQSFFDHSDFFTYYSNSPVTPTPANVTIGGTSSAPTIVVNSGGANYPSGSQIIIKGYNPGVSGSQPCPTMGTVTPTFTSGVLISGTLSGFSGCSISTMFAEVVLPAYGQDVVVIDDTDGRFDTNQIYGTSTQSFLHITSNGGDFNCTNCHFTGGTGNGNYTQSQVKDDTCGNTFIGTIFDTADTWPVQLNCSQYGTPDQFIGTKLYQNSNSSPQYGVAEFYFPTASAQNLGVQIVGNTIPPSAGGGPASGFNLLMGPTGALPLAAIPYVNSSNGGWHGIQVSQGQDGTSNLPSHVLTGNIYMSPVAELPTTVPPSLQYLGTGSDGSCTLSGSYSGEKYCTNFTVAHGSTVTIPTGVSLVVHATGLCTIAGSIVGNGGTNSQRNWFGGGSGGGGGAGSSAGAAGNNSYYGFTNSGTQAASAGAAGSASVGGAGNTPSTTAQRAATNSGAGQDFAPLDGQPGGVGYGNGTNNYGGQGLVLMCEAITGTDGTYTGSIDLAGAPGTPPTANSMGGNGGGGGGVAILMSEAPVAVWPTVYVGGGAGQYTSGSSTTLPQAVPAATSGAVSGNNCTTDPVFSLGVTSGALSSCTVSVAGNCPSANQAAMTWTIEGGGGTGGTITPTWSGTSVASCTASGGSDYTATTYTTAYGGGQGGPGWYSEFAAGIQVH
jgi:hypothetical protein